MKRRFLNIGTLIFIVLISQTWGCGNKKKEEKNTESGEKVAPSDPTGLTFISASIFENGEEKPIAPEAMPYDRCSLYQKRGKTTFDWDFGQGEPVRETANLGIRIKLDSLPTAGQSFEINRDSLEEYASYQVTTYQDDTENVKLWTLFGPDDYCIVRIDSLDVKEKGDFLDPRTGIPSQFLDILSKGHLSCRLSNNETSIVFEAEMSCSGGGTQEISEDDSAE